MKRTLLAGCMCLFLLSVVACNGVAADQAASDTAENPNGEVLAQDSLKTFVSDTTNTEALMEFANANFKTLIQEMSQEGDAAQKHIEGLRKAIADVDAGENQQADGLLRSITRTLEHFEDRLVAKNMTLDQVKAKLDNAPADLEAIGLYTTKVNMVFAEDMNEDIEKMEAFIKSEADYLVGHAEKAEESDVQIAYKKAGIVLQSAAQQVERLKTYQALVGKEMLPIDAEAWANGDGFTAEDLKGKVVLLDFWAVWCGPCVASFPHLVEWQEKYGKDGLQIIGVTRYFNFEWPEDADGPQQADGEVPHAEEVAMLDKFTAEHSLKHPTALLADPAPFYQFYAVSGIPHFVLIDREGKIRKVNAGISEARAKSFEDEIQKLLAEPAPQ
ncbi:redoxin family protein [Bremerella sp. JC770]|uniref:TlpA family protein disulfide reductase n=1 Tax=Bremerella sp. JC770 TaxID=3232137 RepID=UPI00345A63CA